VNNFAQAEFVQFLLQFVCNHGNAIEQGQAFDLIQKYRAPEVALAAKPAPMRSNVLQGLAQSINDLAVFGAPGTGTTEADALFGPQLLQLRSLAAQLLQEVFPGAS